jgi:phosphoribosyl 1,2-cyclic phosphate phosphodiesterase
MRHKTMRLKFTGTGTSVGVPQIGCGCPACTSSDPRDRRRRCGAYVVTDAVHPYLARKIAFLIDTPPEMREACLEYGIDKVDAVVLTHSHMDHVAGFDDVRRFNTLNGGAPMRCYADAETIDSMRRIFPYVGETENELGLYRPMIRFVDDAQFEIGSVKLSRLAVEHGFPCCGYLLEDALTGGRLGYVSDCHDFPEETIGALAGVDVMILNCLRERPHPTHLNIERALGYLGRIRPGKAYLIHMCHDLRHVDWLERLPEGVLPAYDGLEISL